MALDVEAEGAEAESAAPARDSSIAQKAVRGASWSIATGLGSRILGLVGTLALTHFLLPDVIGEVSDAFVVVSMASQLSTWGFGQYLMARPETGPDVTWHATFYHFMLGAFALSAVLILGPRLADFFHAPNLGLYLPGLVGAVFADRIASIPERLLARTMRFKAIGLMRTAGELTYTFVSLGLAVVGFGGMAIVWANVARSIIRAILMIGGVRLSDWLRPHRLSWATTRSMLVFGLPFAVSTNSAFASRRADNLVMSRLFGVAVVGNYQMAYNLADVPAVQVGEQIGDVLLPSFAHLKPEHRGEALIRATGLLSLVVFPLAVGLGAVAHTATAAILPRTWAFVAPMLVVLSALSVTRPIGWTVSAYLVSRERTRTLMFLGLFQVALLLGCVFVLGRMGGPLWACAGVGVAFGLYSLLCVASVHRDGAPAPALLGRCVRPLFACVPMALAVLAVRAGMHPFGMPAMLRLVVEILVGAAAYAGSALVFARDQSQDFLRLVRKAAKRGR